MIANASDCFEEGPDTSWDLGLWATRPYPLWTLGPLSLRYLGPLGVAPLTLRVEVLNDKVSTQNHNYDS